MKDVKKKLHQILFLKLKVRTLMSQFNKNNTCLMLHEREILTSHMLNFRVVITMTLRTYLKNLHKMYMKISVNMVIVKMLQWVLKLKGECLHWMNKSDVNDYHFTSNFQVVDFSYGAKFNEEEIFQASKEEGNLE